MTRRSGDDGWARLDRWLEGVLGRLADRGDLESLVGDLAEDRERLRSAGEPGWRIGGGWLRDVCTSVIPLMARRRARRRRERTGPESREESMGTWYQDLRYAVRSLRQSPGLTAVVVVTLALGVGAGTTVFTVVDNVILNPFPYPSPDRLVGVGPVFPKLGRELSFVEVISAPEWEEIRDQSETLDRVVAWDMGNRAVTVGDRTENLFTAFWYGDAFSTLEVKPALGRGFTAAEVEGGERVAILSHRVWSSRFGADSALVGESILMNGSPYTLVGVMPPGTLVFGTDLWLPMWASPSELPRGRRQLQVLARLAPGATLEAAESELELIADRIEAEQRDAHPEYAGWSLVPMTWTDVNVRLLKPVGLALLGAIAFVLLLVCANVASMLLSRSAVRQREMAVRTALGARRGRILRQLLTESVLLALLGAAGGLLVTLLGVGALKEALTALALPIPGEISVDGRVLGFTTLVAVGTGIAFGLVPSLYAVRLDLRGMLQSDGRGTTTSAGRLRLQRAFVAVEVALAMVLLVGGGLLINSFVRMQRVDPGFETEDLLTLRMTLAWERYEGEEMEPFLRELVRRLEAEPAVTGVATTTQFPPNLFGRSPFWIEGEELGDDATLPTAYATVASPGYFSVLGVPVRAGRVFDGTDGPGGALVAVINEAAASRYFPGRDPVGQRLKLGGPDADNPWFEVIGVVASTRNRGLDAPPAPEIYASVRQLPETNNQHYLVVRAPGSSGSVLPVVRETVRSMDPEQPIYAVRTVEEAYAGGQAQRRIATTTLSLFGLFALLLAAVGIYAVVSFAVAQRTREIGVRMAMGADRGRVRRLIVRQALVPVALGAVVGLAGSVAVGRLMRGLLYEVGAADPATYGAVVLLFGGIAAVASWVPARRASRLDPVLALRED